MIETTHTKTRCKCGSSNVDWKLNVYNQPDWRAKIAEAFAKLKSRRIH